MNFLTVLRDETKYIFSGRFPIVLIIFFVPLLFTILFGVIYEKNVVNNIPMAVYDQDQSKLSRALIQAYNDSERYNIITYVQSQEDLENQILEGKVLIALGIPNNFSKQVKLGQKANILFIVNSTNNMFGNAAISSAQEINRTFSLAVGSQILEAGGLLPQNAINAVYPIHLGVRILNNPINGYGPFMLSGLMLNGFQIGLMLAFAPSVVTEILRRRYGREYSSLAIAIGKFIPYWLASLISFALSLSVIVYYFDIPMHGNWSEALCLAGGFSFFVLCVLMLFSACCPSRILSLQVPMVYIMPGLLYSGLSWPSFDMNAVAGTISLFLPMSWAGDNLRDILLAGYAPRLWHDCMIMFVDGCIAASLATLVVAIRRHYEWKRGNK
ncbi:ABC transporter permease [Pectinatus frisingensis]|uniref:ABC transporter permease n=1 Tax=Pectinatus frisingensis TaxID=865 RepID=UPI0018C569BF|nr:ABC transporter permease [Pectinatus frisingensis]